MPRTSLIAALTCVLLPWFDGGVLAGETVLPRGSAPPPLAARHFPDRVHEFVWRNWNVVEPARMAKLLGASTGDVVALAEAMGLPPAAEIPPEQKQRGYLTLLRRNWHLLPYEQLLELVEMAPEQLDFVLREEDFFWIKLGSLKPKCKPLRYSPPDESARRRAVEIRRVVQEEFGAALGRAGEPRYSFLKRFNQSPVAPAPIHAGVEGGPNLRFIYSYFAPYGDPLSDPKLDPYPDGLLQRLSAVGVNGVWLHVVLRDLAPGGADFPEFGAGHEKRLANLRAIVQRAKKFGIGVYLYLNEPRPMPPDFFRRREAMAGVSEENFGTALCTSHPAVRRWLRDSLTHVFRQVPDLAGVFTITASENLTNCASHYNWRACLRCKDRGYAEIIAEVNATIAEGVHRGNPQARVIVWDWGWHGHGDAADVIVRLPKSVWLMSVSEWNLPLERGGVKTAVGEYAMSAVGPGPRATRHWKLAREAGMKTIAKVQLNNTWELGSIPYLPAMDLVAEHCRNLAAAGVDGMMLSWSLGGYPSPNLEIAARFCTRPTPNIDEVLDAVAVERYGSEGAPLARRAWSEFSAAFREYPFHISGLYLSPVQIGPANPLYCDKTGYRATMIGFPYDDLNSWRGPYPAEVFAGQFEKTAAGWRAGAERLRAAVEKAPSERREEVQSELRFALAAAIHFQSVANQTRFILARNELTGPAAALSPERRRLLHVEMCRCLRYEVALAREMYGLANEDSRIGFEASNHYLFMPLDLAEKVVNCRWLLERLAE